MAYRNLNSSSVEYSSSSNIHAGIVEDRGSFRKLTMFA